MLAPYSEVSIPLQRQQQATPAKAEMESSEVNKQLWLQLWLQHKHKDDLPLGILSGQTGWISTV